MADAQGAAGLEAFLQARLERCTRLEELSLYLRELPCTLGPWLAPLAGSLRRLCVEHSTSEAQWGAVPLRLQPGGLSACTRLEKLVLEGHGLDAPSAACWPQRLTSLSLMLGAGDLPASVSRGYRCSVVWRRSTCAELEPCQESSWAQCPDVLCMGSSCCCKAPTGLGRQLPAAAPRNSGPALAPNYDR